MALLRVCIILRTIRCLSGCIEATLFLQNPSADILFDVLGDNWLEESRQTESSTKWILRNLAGRPKIAGRLFRRSDNDPEHFAEPLRRVTEVIPSTRSPEESGKLAAQHLWYMLIRDYSLRSQTKATDRLPALSGLARNFPEWTLSVSRSSR